VHSPLRVVLPDEASAHSLRRALEPIGVEIENVDGHYEMSVELVDHDPESRVVNALGAIDRWLTTGELLFVQVHLDGAVYTITSPVGAPGSERAAPQSAGFKSGVE
jgi:hypothetical protein